MTGITTQPIEEVIQNFEGDITYDCHYYTARFERSSARRELCRRGLDALPAVVAHLKAKPPLSFMRLDYAWGHLLQWIAINLDPEGNNSGERTDIPSWIDRIEKIIATRTQTA